VDVREHTAGGSAQQLGKLFVAADGHLDVAGHDAVLIVVAGHIAGEFEYLSGEVLEYGSKVHGGTCADAGGVLALLEVASDAAHREVKSRLGGSVHILLDGIFLDNECVFFHISLELIVRSGMQFFRVSDFEYVNTELQVINSRKLLDCVIVEGIHCLEYLVLYNIFNYYCHFFNIL
jgi:hypothetical protein